MRNKLSTFAGYLLGSLLLAAMMLVALTWALSPQSRIGVTLRVDHDDSVSLSGYVQGLPLAPEMQPHPIFLRKTEGFVTLYYPLPAVYFDELRLAPGSQSGVVEITKIVIDSGILGKIIWSADVLQKKIVRVQSAEVHRSKDEVLRVSVIGANPCLYFEKNSISAAADRSDWAIWGAVLTFVLSLAGFWLTQPEVLLLQRMTWRDLMAYGWVVVVIGCFLFFASTVVPGKDFTLAQEMEKRLDKALPGREVMQAVNNYIEVQLFNHSPVKKILVGKGGHVFYRGEIVGDGVNLLDYQGLAPFSQVDVDRIVQRLSQMQQTLAAQGIPFVFIVAPNKETIYPEYLPAYITKVGSSTRMDQVMQALVQHPDIPAIDVRPLLIANKYRGPLYDKYGTHWNLLGGYLAYCAIIEKMQRYYPEMAPVPLSDFNVEFKPNPGRQGLQGVLAMKDLLIDDDDVSLWFEERKNSNRVLPAVNEHGMVEFHTAALYPQKNLLMYRDSFTRFLTPFFNRTIGRATYWRSYSLDIERIKQEKPDIVVLQIAERYLEFLR